jgi:hypothetical protein
MDLPPRPEFVPENNVGTRNAQHVPRVMHIVGEVQRHWVLHERIIGIGFIARWIFERWMGDMGRPKQLAAQVVRNSDHPENLETGP